MFEFVEGLERYRVIQKLAKAGLMFSSVESRFRYAKIKSNTMFFVFDHETGKFDFKLSKSTILERMRVYYREHLSLMKEHQIVFKDIQAVVIPSPKTKPISPHAKVNYSEIATGKFENRCENLILRKTFEEIRELIKKAKHD